MGVILVLVCWLGGLHTRIFWYQPHPPVTLAFVWFQIRKEKEMKKSSKLLK